MTVRKSRISALAAGVIIGAIAVIGQGFLGVLPPPAYGVCMVGHARDIVTTLSNTYLKTEYAMALVSAVKGPSLMVIGILVGGVVGAKIHGDFKFARAKFKDVLRTFMLGFLIMTFGLSWGACPIRTTLYVAYGNLTAIVAFISIYTGVVLGSALLRRRATV